LLLEVIMPFFTIRTTYRLPIFRQRTYEADTIEQACRLAISDEGWSDEESDVDTSGDTYVSGIWQGANTIDRGISIAIPSQFGETIQRKADHFETLLGILKMMAQAPNSNLPKPAFWRTRAEAAIAKAEAILAGARDPD
jgi:hypothetical protein